MPSESFLRDFLINQEGPFFATPTQPIMRDGTPDDPLLGFGRNIKGNPLTEEEKGQIIINMAERGFDPPESINDFNVDQETSLMLLDNGINTSRKEASTLVSNFQDLQPAQQDALAAMVFQIGRGRTSGFTKMLGAIENKDFKKAAKEIQQGKTPGSLSGLAQLSGPRRIAVLQHMMETGKFPKDLSGKSLIPVINKRGN